MIRVAETLSRDRAEFLGTCQRNLPFSKSVEAWKVQSVLCDGTARIPVLRGARNRQEIDRPLFRDATHRLFPPLRSFYRGPPVPGREKEEKKGRKKGEKRKKKVSVAPDGRYDRGFPEDPPRRRSSHGSLWENRLHSLYSSRFHLISLRIFQASSSNLIRATVLALVPFEIPILPRIFRMPYATT